MLVECNNCGAPLDVADNARVTKCAYCGRSNQVRSLRTVAQQRPEGWQPPPQWTPPQHFPQQSVPLQYHAGASGYGRRYMVTGMVAFGVIGVAASIIIPLLAATGSSTSSTAAGVASGEADATAPITCGDGERITRTNETLRFDGPRAVVARGDCEVRLLNCEIEAPDGFEADDDARIEMINGRLDADGLAVRASGDAFVQLTNVSAKGNPGVWTTDDARVKLLNGQLDAEPPAIDATGRSEVTVQNTRVFGSLERDEDASIRMNGEEQGEVAGSDDSEARPRRAQPSPRRQREARAERRKAEPEPEPELPKSPGKAAVVRALKGLDLTKCEGHGKVTYGIRVEPDGTTATTSVGPMRTSGPVLGCVRGAIESLTFPKSQDGLELKHEFVVPE
ncbi:MAG: hypothetical protein ACOCUS_02860 [Polyangiales bacterium]